MGSLFSLLLVSVQVSEGDVEETESLYNDVEVSFVFDSNIFKGSVEAVAAKAVDLWAQEWCLWQHVNLCLNPQNWTSFLPTEQVEVFGVDINVNGPKISLPDAQRT